MISLVFKYSAAVSCSILDSNGGIPLVLNGGQEVKLQALYDGLIAIEPGSFTFAVSTGDVVKPDSTLKFLSLEIGVPNFNNETNDTGYSLNPAADLTNYDLLLPNLDIIQDFGMINQYAVFSNMVTATLDRNSGADEFTLSINATSTLSISSISVDLEPIDGGSEADPITYAIPQTSFITNVNNFTDANITFSSPDEVAYMTYTAAITFFDGLGNQLRYMEIDVVGTEL